MTQAPVDNSIAGPPEAEVNPQRPKPAPSQPASSKPPDAWSRNPRRRALVLLIVNLALFTVACMIFSRLTTGGLLYVTWPPSTYGAALGHLLLDHINIYQVPPQAAVMALMLAVFVVTPIVMAQFYGRLWAAVFLLPLALLAHLPLLTLGLAPALWLARSPLLGIVNRFFRGLTALVFPVAALWISTARTEFVPQSPMNQIFLHVPWAGAIVISIIALLAFWVLARVLNYRAVLGPVLLGVLTGLAVVVFLVGVGMDELDYRFLNAKYGWLASPECQPPEDSADELPDIAAIGKAAENSCSDFLARYKGSRYVPYVLYLKGRSQDVRGIADGGRITYYADVPRAESAGTWQTLVERYPEHPLAVIGRVRLAQHRLGATGLTAAGLAEGRDLLAEVRRRRQSLKPAPPPRLFFGFQPREPQTESWVGQETLQLLDWQVLVGKSHGDDPADRETISRLFALNPHPPTEYQQELKRLQGVCSANLAGDLEVLVDMEEADPARRIERLREFVKSSLAQKDAEACYHAMDKLAGLLIKQKSGRAKAEAIQLWTTLSKTQSDLFAEDARRALEVNRGMVEGTTQPDDGEAN